MRSEAMKLNSYQNLRVPNFSVHNLCEVLKEADLDWRGALLRSDISAESVDRLAGTIPARKELAFQLEFVALTRDRVDLWVRAAAAYTTGTTGARGMALATAPTVSAWLEFATGVDYAPGLLEITPLLTPKGEATGMEYTYPEAPDELIPFSIYRELFVTSRSLTWLYGEPFPFTKVEVPLPEISPEITPYISCNIECNSDGLRLWWDPELSTYKLPSGNAFQHAAWVRADTQVLEAFRDAGDWPATVGQAIRSAPRLNRKLANVAATLRVSPRTLQRKLESTGHDFAQVRDEALFELASDLLSNSERSIAQISRTLGYADPASFTIAFKRWAGVPPSAFRDASRSADNNPG
jgi:AraC-like DNA-binding protein